MTERHARFRPIHRCHRAEVLSGNGGTPRAWRGTSSSSQRLLSRARFRCGRAPRSGTACATAYAPTRASGRRPEATPEGGNARLRARCRPPCATRPEFRQPTCNDRPHQPPGTTYETARPLWSCGRHATRSHPRRSASRTSRPEPETRDPPSREDDQTPRQNASTGQPVFRPRCWEQTRPTTTRAGLF